MHSFNPGYNKTGSSTAVFAHLGRSWQISAEDADACPSACNDDVGCCLDWVAAGEAIAVTSLAEVQSIAEAQSNAVSFNALDPPSALEPKTTICSDRIYGSRSCSIGVFSFPFAITVALVDQGQNAQRIVEDTE